MAVLSPFPRRSLGALKAAAAIGLTLFASVMLLFTGVLAVYRGFMGIARDGVFVATRDYVSRFHLLGGGWVHLCLGVVATAVGAGLLTAALWARVLGVAMMVLLIVVHLLTAPYFPEWSFLLIALYGLVIWALCVSDRAAFAGLWDGR
ncbi:hypothetical protein ACIHAA_24850 [Streptomyces sp. NPDC052040]|uniref:DUF7144 family membrane protein n=1 Tax=unclassified Streptomyces TaxID=2593676 RepID=UPI0037D63577